MKLLARAFNPLAIPVAGSGLIPIWGVVRHTGRRSGRAYATPVALMATKDSFVIPLPYGSKTDWCRNLMSTGTGAIRWRGTEYPVREPQLIGPAVATAAFPRVFRPLLPVLGIHQFLQLRRADPAQANSGAAQGSRSAQEHATREDRAEVR
jgi:deazaflavin-dependent oxidoreductase (nitroreductase family)